MSLNDTPYYNHDKTYHSRPGFQTPRPLTVGHDQDTLSHVIEYWDSGDFKQGQVWSLAPKSDFDSSAYWVVPFDDPTHVIRVVKIHGRFTR